MNPRNHGAVNLIPRYDAFHDVTECVGVYGRDAVLFFPPSDVDFFM